jgi:hypothetical protein
MKRRPQRSQTKSLSSHRDGAGKLQRCLASATAYVEDALTRNWRKRLQSPPTERSELQLQ